MIRRLFGVVLAIVTTALQHTLISHRSRQKLAAEDLFLRKQLALFKEREIKPRRADDATGIQLAQCTCRHPAGDADSLASGGVRCELAISRTRPFP
jgi:hypothetical protein